MVKFLAQSRKNYVMPDTPNTVAGINYQDLTLVRVQGGLDGVQYQNGALILNRSGSGRADSMNTAHFTLNSIVQNHALGTQFDGSDIVIISPLDRAIREGGNTPSGLSAGDTWIHADTQGRINLPGARILAPNDAVVPPELESLVTRYPRGNTSEETTANRNRAVADSFERMNVPLKRLMGNSGTDTLLWAGTDRKSQTDDLTRFAQQMLAGKEVAVGALHMDSPDGRWEMDMSRLRQRISNHAGGQRLEADDTGREHEIFPIIKEQVAEMGKTIDARIASGADPKAVEFYRRQLGEIVERVNTVSVPQRRREVAAMLGDGYYYSNPEQTHRFGPVTGEQLVTLGANDGLNGRLIWQQGMKDWERYDGSPTQQRISGIHIEQPVIIRLPVAAFTAADIRERLGAIIDIHPSPDMVNSGLYPEYRTKVIDAMAAQVGKLPAYAQNFILNSDYRFGFGDSKIYVESQFGESLAVLDARGAHNTWAHTITSVLAMKEDGWDSQKKMPKYVIDEHGINDALSTILHETGHGLDAQIGRQAKGTDFSLMNFLSTAEIMRDFDRSVEVSLQHNGITASQFISGDMRKELDELMRLSSKATAEVLYHGLPESIQASERNPLPLMHAMAPIYVLDANGNSATHIGSIDRELSRITEPPEITAEMFRHYFTMKGAGLSDNEIGERFKKVSPELWQWFSAEVLPRADSLNISPRPISVLLQRQNDRYLSMVGYAAAENGGDIASAQRKAIEEMASLSSAQMAERIDILQAQRMERMGPYYLHRKSEVAALDEYFKKNGITQDAGEFFGDLQRRTGKAASYDFEAFVRNKDKFLRMFSIASSHGDLKAVAEFVQAKHGVNITSPATPKDALTAYIALADVQEDVFAKAKAMNPPPKDLKVVLAEHIQQEMTKLRPPPMPEVRTTSVERPVGTNQHPAAAVASIQPSTPASPPEGTSAHSRGAVVTGIVPQPLPTNDTPTLGAVALAPEPQQQLHLAPATETVVNPVSARAAANDPKIDVPVPAQKIVPAAPVVAKTPTTHIATRTTSGAGAGLSIKGLVDRTSEGGSWQKAKQVGGEQLTSERAAAAGDFASILAGTGDILGKSGRVIGTAARVAPIVAAGAAVLEVNAANKAQDGRRGIGAITGFIGGMGSGLAAGFVGGATVGPWTAAGGGLGGALVGGYLSTEAGRESQLGDQRQRDLDHAAQAIIDKNIATFQTLEKMRLNGAPWFKSEQKTVRQIANEMREQYMRLSVLDIPATDIDGRLRQDFQKHQTLQFIGYLNGKEGVPMPQTSIEVASNLSRKLDALLPQLDDPRLGWQKYLDADGDGKVSRSDVLATLSKYGAEIHTLSMDGVNLTIGELTGALKAFGIDKGTTRTERVGRAIQTTSLVPLINDEVHINFGSRTGYSTFVKAIEAQLPELEKLGISKYIGNGDNKLTIDEVMATCKKNGIKISEIDRNVDGNITAGEIIQALNTRGIIPPDKGKDSSSR